MKNIIKKSEAVKTDKSLRYYEAYKEIISNFTKKKNNSQIITKEIKNSVSSEKSNDKKSENETSKDKNISININNNNNKSKNKVNVKTEYYDFERAHEVLPPIRYEDPYWSRFRNKVLLPEFEEYELNEKDICEEVPYDYK